MRTIAIMNYKGGVGKTTTAVNLAAGLSRHDKKVLLIDFDPQGNVDISLKVEAEHNLYDVLTGKVTLQRCIVNLAKNLDVITSRETLVKAEHYLSTQASTKNLLRDLLSSIRGYDYVIVDCPPSLGILNQNVLSFCKEVFVPTSSDFLGFDALKKMQEIVTKINQSYGHNSKITKVIPTLFDKRNKICREMLLEIKGMFPHITTQPIRSNSKLKEAPKYGKSIFSYARSSPGAQDYGQLAKEVVDMETIASAPEIEIVS